MRTSSDRILTTHVGSLPRSAAVTDVVFGRERGEEAPDGDEVISAAVDDVVGRQVASGVDVVSDGEMSKISYATYIKDRITGFDGDSNRAPPRDLEEFPGYLERQAASGGTPTYRDRAASARSRSRTCSRSHWTSPISRRRLRATGRLKGS